MLKKMLNMIMCKRFLINLLRFLTNETHFYRGFVFYFFYFLFILLILFLFAVKKPVKKKSDKSSKSKRDPSSEESNIRTLNSDYTPNSVAALGASSAQSA